jgi:hypothetical protein
LLLLLWATSTALGQGAVDSKISYQGTLLQSGQPVNGSRNMVFRLYSDAACSVQVGGDIARNGVPVNNGFFSVELDMGQNHFYGRALWLETEVEGSLIGCQEILPTPYALSLRPGAQIRGSSGSEEWGDSLLNIEHSGAGRAFFSKSDDGTGVHGYSRNSTGVSGRSDAAGDQPTKSGVYGYATGGFGLYGETVSSSSAVAAVRGDSSTAAYGGDFYSKEGVGLRGIGTGPEPTTPPYRPYASGVYGYSTGGVGVFGETVSSASSVPNTPSSMLAGVRGIANVDPASTNILHGVYGESRSREGAGVYASNTSNNSSVSPDLILGASDFGHGGDNGILSSEPSDADSDLLIFSNDEIEFRMGRGNTEEARFSVRNGTSDFVFSVDEAGNVRADGTYFGSAGVDVSCAPNCADFAETMDADGSANTYEPGHVLVVNEQGLISLSGEPYAPNVIGVYSTRPAFLAQAGQTNQQVPVALVGTVPVKVSAENGPIRPGDLLASASIPGHAMRCEGVELCFGRTIGKALESLTEGTGVIQMLVILQ